MVNMCIDKFPKLTFACVKMFTPNPNIFIMPLTNTKLYIILNRPISAGHNNLLDIITIHNESSSAR